MSSEPTLSFDEVFKSSIEKGIWGIKTKNESGGGHEHNSDTEVKQYSNFIIAFKELISSAIYNIDEIDHSTETLFRGYVKRKYFIKQKELEQEWFNKVNNTLRPIFIEESLHKDDLEETCDESEKIKSKDKPREIENCESDESDDNENESDEDEDYDSDDSDKYPDKYPDNPVYEDSTISVITYNNKDSKFIEKIVPKFKKTGKDFDEKTIVIYENIEPTIDIITEYYKKKDTLTARDINKYLKTLEYYCNFVIYYCANRCKVYICRDYDEPRYSFTVSLSYNKTKQIIEYDCNYCCYGEYSDGGEYYGFTDSTLIKSKLES